MSNNPWELYPHIWSTKSKFMSWIRSGLRNSLWSRSPIKLEFIKKYRKKIKNPKIRNLRNKAEIWGAECCICGNDYPLNKIEVDHKIGNHSLRDISDIEPFIISIVIVNDDDIQLICKNCHQIKTHAEKYNITFMEASRSKKIIAYGKLPVEKQKEILAEHNLPNSNAKIRKDGFIKIIDLLPLI